MEQTKKTGFHQVESSHDLFEKKPKMEPKEEKDMVRDKVPKYLIEIWDGQGGGSSTGADNIYNKVVKEEQDVVKEEELPLPEELVHQVKPEREEDVVEEEQEPIDLVAEEEEEDSCIDISSDDDDGDGDYSPPSPPRRRKARASTGKRKRVGRPRKNEIKKVGRPRKLNIDSQPQQVHYPTFKLRVEPKHLTHSNVLVPYHMVRLNLPQTLGELTLRVGSGEWKVKFMRFTSNKTGRMSVGWLDFAEANSLKVGDVCVFKMVRTGVFHVAINDDDA